MPNPGNNVPEHVAAGAASAENTPWEPPRLSAVALAIMEERRQRWWRENGPGTPGAQVHREVARRQSAELIARIRTHPSACLCADCCTAAQYWMDYEQEKQLADRWKLNP